MNIVFDFDSTIVQAEGLDVLAEICFEGNIQKVLEIEMLTNLAMSGKLSLKVSLSERIKSLNPNKKHIKLLQDILVTKISPSINALKPLFENSKVDLFVLSGGFMEYVLPVCVHIGFLPSHIFANKFIYRNDLIIGLDDSIPLSNSLGKVVSIKNMGMKSPIYLIGDGYTDLETKLNGAVDYFIAYTETVHRDNVVDQADFVCKNFNEVMNLIYESKI